MGQAEEWEAAWEEFDKDGDGNVSKRHLQAALKCTDEQMAEIFNLMEEDGDSIIEHDEYMSLCEPLRQKAKAKLIADFEAMDTSDDGLLSFDEVKAVFAGAPGLTEKQKNDKVAALFKTYDDEGTAGSLSISEVKDLLDDFFDPKE